MVGQRTIRNSTAVFRSREGHWLAPNLANTSRKCRGNLEFVVWTYGLYVIAAAWAMPLLNGGTATDVCI